MIKASRLGSMPFLRVARAFLGTDCLWRLTVAGLPLSLLLFIYFINLKYSQPLRVIKGGGLQHVVIKSMTPEVIHIKKHKYYAPGNKFNNFNSNASTEETAVKTHCGNFFQSSIVLTRREHF